MKKVRVWSKHTGVRDWGRFEGGRDFFLGSRG